MNSPDFSYEAWLTRFKRLATQRDLAWIVSTEPDAHRAAYESGLTPDEELTALADMGQWRGCVCGGS
jgi:hypothetical protein